MSLGLRSHLPAPCPAPLGVLLRGRAHETANSSWRLGPWPTTALPRAQRSAVCRTNTSASNRRNGPQVLFRAHSAQPRHNHSASVQAWKRQRPGPAMDREGCKNAESGRRDQQDGVHLPLRHPPRLRPFHPLPCIHSPPPFRHKHRGADMRCAMYLVAFSERTVFPRRSLPKLRKSRQGLIRHILSLPSSACHAKSHNPFAEPCSRGSESRERAGAGRDLLQRCRKKGKTVIGGAGQRG